MSVLFPFFNKLKFITCLYNQLRKRQENTQHWLSVINYPIRNTCSEIGLANMKHRQNQRKFRQSPDKASSFNEPSKFLTLKEYDLEWVNSLQNSIRIFPNELFILKPDLEECMWTYCLWIIAHPLLVTLISASSVIRNYSAHNNQEGKHHPSRMQMRA